MEIAFNETCSRKPVVQRLTKPQRKYYDYLAEHALKEPHSYLEASFSSDSRLANKLSELGLIEMTGSDSSWYNQVRIKINKFLIKVQVGNCFDRNMNDVCKHYVGFAPDLYTAFSCAEEKYGDKLRGVEFIDISETVQGFADWKKFSEHKPSNRYYPQLVVRKDGKKYIGEWKTTNPTVSNLWGMVLDGEHIKDLTGYEWLDETYNQ